MEFTKNISKDQTEKDKITKQIFKMKKQFFANKNACLVTFELPKEATKGVKAVTVYGEFNEWKPLKLKKKKDGCFSLDIELETGKEYQFRYLLDNDRWENDWNADSYILSPYVGIENSVVNVPTNEASAETKVTRRVINKQTATVEKKSKKVKAKKAEKKAKKVEKKTAKSATKAKKATKATAKKVVSKAKTKAAPKKATTKKVTVKAAPKKSTAKKVVAKKVTATKTAIKKTVASKKDDLKKIEGIGPKIAEHLQNAGIKTFAALSKASVSKLNGILEKAGPRYKMHVPTSWPKQAALAVKGDWAGLEKLQAQLKGGR